MRILAQVTVKLNCPSHPPRVDLSLEKDRMEHLLLHFFLLLHMLQEKIGAFPIHKSLKYILEIYWQYILVEYLD